MKIDPPPPTTIAVTLQAVLDRIVGNPELSPRRKRDLLSAVRSYAKLLDQPPAAIPLDLAAIRHTLDRIVPPRALISAKRFANIRSDTAAAIEASGVHPMLMTARVVLDDPWRQLLAEAPQRYRHALSRLARWATLRGVPPERINEEALQQFSAELHSSTLVRNLRFHERLVRRAWNVVAAQRSRKLRILLVEPKPRAQAAAVG